MDMFYSRSIFQLSMDQRQRFNELAKMAKMLHTSCVEGERLLPGFTNVIGDTWIAFYSLYPQFMPSAQQIDAMQFKFMMNLMSTDEYMRWHRLTQGDELLSVLTTIGIAEQLKKNLEENQVAREATLQKKLAMRGKEHASAQLQQLLRKMADPGATKEEKDRAVWHKDIVQRRLATSQKKELQENEILRKQLAQINPKQLIRLLKTSTEKVKYTKNAIIAIGTMDGKKITQVPLGEQFELASHLRDYATLKKIADLAGRFKKIAQKKQKTKQTKTMERKHVTLGQEVSRLLPTELANLITPHSRIDFLRRFSEQQTFIFDTKGKDRRGKGPIIICMDESSSMTSIKEESKAFCMALLMIARKQKRDFAIIPFASNVGEVRIFKKGRATTNDLIAFSESFLGGGTNYEKPLRESLDILMQSEFNEADMLFVTDGSSFLPTSFIEEFNEIKKRKQFDCTAIVLTNLYNVVDLEIVGRFSDKVIEVNELFDAGEAFSL